MVSAAPLRALLLEDIHPDAAAPLRAAGYDVEQLTRALEGKELNRRLDGVDVLGIRSKTTVTAEVLQPRRSCWPSARSASAPTRST